MTRPPNPKKGQKRIPKTTPMTMALFQRREVVADQRVPPRRRRQLSQKAKAPVAEVDQSVKKPRIPKRKTVKKTTPVRKKMTNRFLSSRHIFHFQFFSHIPSPLHSFRKKIIPFRSCAILSKKFI